MTSARKHQHRSAAEWRAEEARELPYWDWANPDCDRCGGDGGTLHAPCPSCVVEVWS